MMLSLFVFLLLTTVRSGIGFKYGHEERLSPDVEALAMDYWNWRLYDKPEFATFVGVHDYDDRLDDMSLEAYKARYDQCEIFLKRAQELEANHTDHADLVNIKALKAELETYIDGYKYQMFLVPLCFSEGIHVDFVRLISWMNLETAEDFEKLLSRYEKLGAQVLQIRDLLEEGVRLGIVNHQISMKGVIDGVGQFIVGAGAASPLWPPFDNMPDTIPPDQALDLQLRALDTIFALNEPFKDLKRTVENYYYLETREDIAVTSLPNGIELYNQLIRFHTSSNMSPHEIHQMGQNEVERIEGEMKKIVEELGYDMSVPEFSNMIRNDSSFYYDNPDDLLAGFQDIVYNVITPKIPKLFMNIPKEELEVVADPSPEGVGAFYLGGSYDGSRPGRFYVNTYHYDAQAKFEMMTLSLHEGNPGHHLQGAHSIESPNMPFFRRVTEDRQYCEAPSRFPVNSAFIEGWGLYAESLGFDLEVFGDPYDRYGHYSDEIFRACRMVVDTGMHALGWTRQEAIDYMYLHTALSLIEIENEVDRYITWPGQAIAYKVGERKFAELKSKSQEELGEEFDIKKFHDIVLESVGPLYLVQDEINDWIEAGGGR